MYTYRVDLKELTFLKMEYDRRNPTSIWINGRRRDAVTDRYAYVDDLTDVKALIEDKLIELEAHEQVELNKKFKARREQLAKSITDASTSFGRL